MVHDPSPVTRLSPRRQPDAGRRVPRTARLADRANTKRGRTANYSVGYAAADKVRDAISKVPEVAWAPAITNESEARHNGDVVEITDMLN